MLGYILNEQKKKKNLLLMLIIFTFFILLYTFLDNFGYQSYASLGDAFGFNVVVNTIGLNIGISLISAFTISISILNYRINNTKSSGSIFASIGNVFAVVFTGCASCGISLIGAIGISIGLPTILPGAVKYKFFALLVMILGLILVMYLINTSTCSVKKGGKK